MAKILITDPTEGKQAPFLRGILTRSLQEAGLSFEEAYKMASAIRQELGDTPEITTGDLRLTVARHLEQTHGATIAQRYQTPSYVPVTILVDRTSELTTPFSRGELRRSLVSCGLSEENTLAIISKIYEHLIAKGIRRISSGQLGLLVYRYLRREMGQDVARRYMVWVDYLHGNRPLLILIGGTAGCGKSTVATELASRLDIVRTQSTDMLREVMRTMLPSRLLPVLHVSSFRAWEALPAPAELITDHNALLADGFLTQAELLSVACEAVVQRALKERVSLILEGVHIHPTFLNDISQGNEAIVVPIMLAVLKPDQLRKRFRGRGKQAPNRRAERYLNNFDAIWQLQSFLLSEADRLHMPIIPNDDKEQVIQQAMGTIIDALSIDFSATPEEVFA